jgi:thymidylate synthase
MRLEKRTFGLLWQDLVRELFEAPESSPRGMKVREMTNVNIVIEHARHNVLVHPVRRLSYKFMVAEWLWIWFGREDVATIEQYNPHIAQFSDNGVDFNGSYGPPIERQWPYVRKLLEDDPDSRQAIISIYRQPQGPTKDVPCTISLQFLIRSGELHTIATMRSSDVWLGLPYDTFNFSMFGNILAAQLGVSQGSLSFNLGSSHLYERDFEKAEAICGDVDTIQSPILNGAPPPWLEHVLVTRKSLGMNDWLWGRYARVLIAKTNKDALAVLDKA